MSEVMTCMPFEQLMNWVLEEKKTKGTVFGQHRAYAAETDRKLNIFERNLETPIGPAAGPHTQLTQNIVASYYAGARFFELKTVQKMDGAELAACINRPCILADDEGYNCEWSTELYVPQAMGEYIKAWFILHVIAKEFDLGAQDGFQFNISVGYDLAGIKESKVNTFIDSMMEAKDTEIFKECKQWLLDNVDKFEKVTKDVVYTALYDVMDIKYTVKFVNSNGEVISEQNLKYGDKIVKPGNPKYPGNKDIYEHTFAGWDKEVSDVCTGDATYKAVFDKSIKIAFYKYNIEASSRKDLFDYEYITGREPKYFTKLGSTITVTNDFTGYENIISMLEEAYIKGESDTIYGNNNEEFVKSFVSLTAEKAGVKEDAVDCWYVLKREVDGWHVDGGNLKDYTVKFVDYDDSIISERIYNANEKIVIPSNPVRESDETYNYTFAGWDKEISTEAVSDVVYKAVYEPSYIDYTVRFLNEDGSVITEATYHYGEDVVIPADPAKEADETYTYTFAGWDKEVTSVKENVDYTATYTERLNRIPEVEGDEDIVPEINPDNNASDDNKPSVRPVRKPEVEADEDVATGDGNMTLYIAILGLSAATLAVIMGRKKEQDI